MESKTTSGVIRRKPPSFRHYPYAIGSDSGRDTMKEEVKDDMKEEVIRLGVKLSVSVAESMFLLCDDIRTMLSFCYKLWRLVQPYPNPVLIRLVRVIYYVYLKDIKPKNGVYQSGCKSAQWNLIRTAWSDFVSGIIVLHRLVLALRREDSSVDDRLVSLTIVMYKQGLKNLDGKLRYAKHVSEANGFVRDTIESNISYLWNSLFNEEESGKETPEVLKNRISRDMFNQLLATSLDGEISALPIYAVAVPYTLGMDVAKEELKKEVVRLGVELSLYVAQSMFLLCDDILSMWWFCSQLWRDAIRNMNPNSPVAERLLRVIHYVYIKAKNGVYKNDGISVHKSLAESTWRAFEYGVTYLNLLVSKLGKEGSCSNSGRLFTSRIEQVVKKLEETLSCSKAVSEANGFVREGIEQSMLGLWKSLFDKEAKEATQTLKVIKNRILRDLLLPSLY